MQTPFLPRRKDPSNETTELLLIAIVGRMDGVVERLDHVATRMDNLAAVIVENQQANPKNKGITTVVALVIFALTVLTALIVKGCGVI